MKRFLQNVILKAICTTKLEPFLLFSGGSSGGQAFKNNRAISVQASIFLYFVFSSQNVLLESCQNRTILARRVFLFTDLIANKTLSQCWRLNLSNFLDVKCFTGSIDFWNEQGKHYFCHFHIGPHRFKNSIANNSYGILLNSYSVSMFRQFGGTV